jgi:phosphoglycerate dehydrogenase-like enzyme
VVSRYVRALGARVLVHTVPSAGLRSNDGAVPREVPLEELLSASDIVTLHTPLTAMTARMLDRTRLALMKPTAFVVNTARADLIDQGALVAALRSNRLGGAALDVYHDSPGVAELRSHPRVILTPHIAGSTHESLNRVSESAIASVLAAKRGKLIVDDVVNEEALNPQNHALQRKARMP